MYLVKSGSFPPVRDGHLFVQYGWWVDNVGTLGTEEGDGREEEDDVGVTSPLGQE